MRQAKKPTLHHRFGAFFLRFAFLACILSLVLSVYLYQQFSPASKSGHKFAISPGRHIKLNSTIPTPPEYTPPLHTQGRLLLDSANRPVNLISINWYGASDIHFIPSGLDIRHRDSIARLIRQLGFNSVRLPYSDELVRSNPRISPALVAANPDLANLQALAVYHAVVTSLTDAGLMVIPNDHITQAAWCCGANLCDAGWSNTWLWPLCRVKQSEEEWVENWEGVMRMFVDNPLVIGADLRNEVRAPWGTLGWGTWAKAAEKAAERLLKLKPEWLIFVEGISSANDLSGVRKRPVKLSVEGRVVYSAHVYGWSGWGELQPYKRTSYERFSKKMMENWGYLLEQDIAPVWVGEFGAPDKPSDGDLNYWKHLIEFLRERKVGHWGYWAVNPRKPDKNEYESYGLLDDDWETVRWDYRLDDLAKIGLTVDFSVASKR